MEIERIRDPRVRWEFLKYEIKKLDKRYEQKINGIRIRSKCHWYEYGKKSPKFFLNLGKTRSTQSTIRNITKDKRNLTCNKRINQELFDFL